MLEFAPICIYLVISPLVSLISLDVPFPLAYNSSTYPERLSALHFRLVMGILEKEPIVRVALSIAFGVYAVSSICWMFAGGIGDAIVPFLTRNGNPDPGLPPSSSGEPIMGLLLTENHRHDEMSTTLLEIPSVAEEEIWAAVDLQEQPVISDAERREILEQKLRNHGRKTSTRIGEELLEKQMLLEKTLEKHLLRYKYTPKRIRRAFPEFREKLFYFRGKPRKIPELAGWIDEMEGNFLSSSPYRLIIHLQILFTPQELNVKE